MNAFGMLIGAFIIGYHTRELHRDYNLIKTVQKRDDEELIDAAKFVFYKHTLPTSSIFIVISLLLILSSIQ